MWKHHQIWFLIYNIGMSGLIYTHSCNMKLYKNYLKIGCSRSELQENSSSRIFFLMEFTKEIIIPEKQGVRGSTLSGQVPDRYGKSILMASLIKLIT